MLFSLSFLNKVTNNIKGKNMSLSNSHLDIAIESISCFSNDGTLDAGEVRRLVGLALRDEVVDDEEKRVLRNIFNKVTQGEVSADTWAAMEDARRKYDF